MVSGSLSKACKTSWNYLEGIGAGDEDRTRNFQLGKLTLYH